MTSDPSISPPTPPPSPAPVSVAPKKRSTLTWLLGGCAFLAIVGIVVAVVLFRSVSKLTLMNTKVVDQKSVQKNPPPLSNADLRTKSAPAPAPAGWVTYVDKREDHPKLRDDFVAFSISYPPEFTKKDAPDAFLDVQKLDAATGDIVEEVSVNPASYPKEPPLSEYDGALDKMSGFLKQVLSDLRMGPKESVTMDGVTGRAANYQGDLKGVHYTGRLAMLFPKGSSRGVFFLTLEKEPAAGTAAKILQTFRW